MIRRPVLPIVLLLACCFSASAGESDRWTNTEFLPGRLVVRFHSSATMQSFAVAPGGLIRTGAPSLDEIFEEYEVTATRPLVPEQILSRLPVTPDLFDTYVIRFREEYSVLDLLDRLAADPHVQWVEPDILRRAFRVPNDPFWNSQWDKRLMGADDVWDISTGSEAVICAGIDTGVDWNHPDLAPSLWVNPGEDVNGDRVPWVEDWYPGDLYNDLNDVDDDSNGYTDDFLGWDFIRDIWNCSAGEDCDDQADNDMFGRNDHGTHVAGIMAARGDNGIGVTGVSWVGKLMALRAGYDANDGQGYIPESASTPAILYAAANGAKIINMSYGGPGSSSQAEAAINAAWNAGCLLFAASGNDGSTEIQYPAGFENVVAVNATNNTDHLAGWSNRGPWTELCAPGSDPGIMSTIINGYAAFWGTSMASPNAGGVAALVWSVFPQMTNVQIRDLLFNTAVNIAPSNPGVPPSYLGHGRVDAARAVAAFYPQLRITGHEFTETAGDQDGRLEAGENMELELTVTNVVGWADGDNVTAVVSSADPRVVVSNGTWYIGDLAEGQSANNGANPALVSAIAGLDTVFWHELDITFSSPNGYQETQHLTMRVGRGRVLLVDDDGTVNYERYLDDGLHASAASTDLWTVSGGNPLTSGELSQYATVLWSCGNQQTNTLTAADQIALTTYLNSGGNLILVGQNIDEDLRGSAFYQDYLHVQSGNADGDRTLAGVGGDPISAGMSLLLAGGACAGNGSLSPSQIVPQGDAVGFFTYSAGGIGAVRWSGPYKVAYFAFALESACGAGGTTHLSEVLAATLSWMGALPAEEPRPAPVPQATALLGNYPNPFNPRTTVAFELAARDRVRLQVFDVLGRSVATLLDAPLSAGRHEAVFDGSGLAAGLYLVRLETGSVSRTAKMMLVK